MKPIFQNTLRQTHKQLLTCFCMVVVSGVIYTDRAQGQGVVLPPVSPLPQPPSTLSGPVPPPILTVPPFTPSGPEDLAKDPNVEGLQSYSAQDITAGNGVFTTRREGNLGRSTFSLIRGLSKKPGGGPNGEDVAQFDADTFFNWADPSQSFAPWHRTQGAEVWTQQFWPLKDGRDLCWEATVRLFGAGGPRGVIPAFFSYNDKRVASERAGITNGNLQYGDFRNEIDFEYLHNLIPQNQIHLNPWNLGSQNPTNTSVAAIMNAQNSPGWSGWWDYKITWSYKEQGTFVRWFMKPSGFGPWRMIRQEFPERFQINCSPPLKTPLPNNTVVPTELRLHFNIWSASLPGDSHPGADPFPEAFDQAFIPTPANSPNRKRTLFQVASARVYYRRASKLAGNAVTTTPPRTNTP